MVEAVPHRRLRPLPDPLAARRRRQPGRGAGGPAPGARAAAGIEAPAAEWEAPDAPGPRHRLRPALARRAVPLGRGGVGTPHPPAPSGPAAVGTALAGHAVGLRRAATTSLRSSRAVRAGAVAPEPEVGAPADVLAALRTPGRLLPPRARAVDRAAPGRGRRGPVGPRRPRPRHRRRLLGRPLPALRPRPLADAGPCGGPSGGWPGAGLRARDRRRGGPVVAPARGRGARVAPVADGVLCRATRSWPRRWR